MPVRVCLVVVVVADSRVTPQAVEAAERALVASTSPWPITDELWEKVKRTLGPNGTSSRREIELFLAAAAPLLCQPLQDENERLRAALHELGPELYEAARRHGSNDLHHRFGDLLAAAVPVGTGNPTQPRADD